MPAIERLDDGPRRLLVGMGIARGHVHVPVTRELCTIGAAPPALNASVTKKCRRSCTRAGASPLLPASAGTREAGCPSPDLAIAVWGYGVRQPVRLAGGLREQRAKALGQRNLPLVTGLRVSFFP